MQERRLCLCHCHNDLHFIVGRSKFASNFPLNSLGIPPYPVTITINRVKKILGPTFYFTDSFKSQESIPLWAVLSKKVKHVGNNLARPLSFSRVWNEELLYPRTLQ